MSEIKNIGQLINALATKAGIEGNNQALVDILSNAELSKIPIHVDLAKALDENLLSLEAAKDNHPVIGNMYRAQALSTLDKLMQRVVDEIGLDDESKTAFSAERSSYKRFENLISILKQAKTDKGSSKVEKDAYQKQIDDLQEALRVSKDALKTKESEFATQRKNDLIDFKLRNLFTGYKTVFDDLDPDIKHASLISAINKELQGKEAKFDVDENNQLVLLRNDGTKLYGQNNVAVDAKNLLDSTFATNKILKVSESSQQQQQPGSQQQQQKTTVPPGTKTVSGTNQSVADFNEKMIAALSAQEN